MLGIIAIILDAISALAGPAANMMRSLFSASRDFHAGSDATPDEIAAQAIQIAQQAVTLEQDVHKQIAQVSAALQASHSDMPPIVAAHNAVAAVAHVSQLAVQG